MRYSKPIVFWGVAAALVGVNVTAQAQSARLGAWSKILIASGRMNSPLFGQDIPPVSDDKKDKKELPPTQAQPEGPKRIPSAFKLGMEYWYGMSNVTGTWRRTTDSVWAGAMTFAPSNLNLTWNKGGQTARAAFGIGDNYIQAGGLDQPVELYYQSQTRTGDSVTMGKFFSPFGQNEWQFESKYGMMFQGARGAYNFAASVQYNQFSDNANLYFRVGGQASKRTAIGVSGGLGKGLSYASSHSALVGVDLIHDFGGMTFNAEWTRALSGQGDNQFMMGKLTFTKLGKFAPYLGAYYWHDSAGQLGNFRSGLIGVNYQATSYLSLDTGFARTPGRDVFWFQTRLAF